MDTVSVSVHLISVYKFSCATYAKGHNQKESHYMDLDFCTIKCLSTLRRLNIEEENKRNPPVDNNRVGRIEQCGGN